MKQIKLHWKNKDELQAILGLLIDTYQQGACFYLTDREKIIYKHASSIFDVPNTEVGTSNKKDGVTDNIISSCQVKLLHLDRNLYGVRVNVIAGPLWSDDEEEIMGTWMMVLPKLHTLAQSFEYYAPVLTDMFSEGGILFLTDKEKFAYKQGSVKFDLPELQVGKSLSENDISMQAMRKRDKVVQEIPKQRWGKDVMATCYPMIDEDIDEVVGAFGLLLPRELPLKLKEMANNMGKGLTEVSAAMEEIAASASEISQNQNILNKEIETVQENAQEINNVLSFIKEIADETKMLGLNAAIEAARAGEMGRGFGVVAEEIRNLSDQSKQTVVQIKELTDRIHTSINDTKEVSNATVTTTEQEAAATEEVNASIEEMTGLAEELDALTVQL